MKRESKGLRGVNRRDVLRAAGAAAAITIVPRHVLGQGQVPPSEKMNVGNVGVGGMQGANDTRAVSGENTYAICDIDERNLRSAATIYTSAKTYKDFREMLDKEAKNLHGITITIPDFMHATVALWAMERGIAVYVQKPLTQTVWEARLLAKAAQKYKVATQMGNQGYSAIATRIACEVIWHGDLGEIKEVHAMHAGGFSRGITEWPAEEPIPPALDWDLWQGRAQEHTYSSKIHPSNWRGFLEYGTQMVGDWGIHILGPANWGLALGHAASVECTAVEGANPVTYPHYACKWEFPERPNKQVPGGKMPPVMVHWYEGNMARTFQPPAGLTVEDVRGYNEVFVGTKGFMGTTGRGESVRLVPESKMEGYKKPEAIIERSPGHFQDWIRAVKGGQPACSNFSIAGPYTEWMLLGAISWRFPNEKLIWDGPNMRFTNNEKANEFVKPNFRKGWELKDITV